MTQDDDWSDLSTAWTEAGPDAPVIDAHVIAGLKRRDTWARLNFGFEVLISVAALAFVVWAFMTHTMDWPPAAASFAFIVFATVMTLWSRQAAPRLDVDTPAGALRTAAAQARSGQRWAWAGLAMCATGVIYLAVMVGITGPVPKAAQIVLVATGVFLLGWVAVYITHIRSAGRRRAAHLKALTALEVDGAI